MLVEMPCSSAVCYIPPEYLSFVHLISLLLIVLDSPLTVCSSNSMALSQSKAGLQCVFWSYCAKCDVLIRQVDPSVCCLS